MKWKQNWETIREYDEIKFDFFEGIAKISINRPEKHNAFTPRTVKEMIDAMNICRDDENIDVIIFSGEGGKAFCSGGDQGVRGHGGYVGTDDVPRLNVLDLQKQIRSISKVVIAAVAGWSIGGGHVLHVVCDLTIAAENAMFGQTGPFGHRLSSILPAHRCRHSWRRYEDPKQKARYRKSPDAPA